MKAFLGRFKVDFFIAIFRNRVLFNMMSSSMTHSFWRSCDKLRPNLLFLYCSLITNITRIILRVLQFLGFTLIKNIKIKRPVGIFEVAIQHFFKFLNLFSFILKLSFQLLQGWRKGVILDLKVISGLLTLKSLIVFFSFWLWIFLLLKWDLFFLKIPVSSWNAVITAAWGLDLNYVALNSVDSVDQSIQVVKNCEVVIVIK